VPDSNLNNLRRWQDELAGWTIPDDLLAAAPESPWSFPAELFGDPGPPVDSPSRQRALGTLPDGGSVLDVGCGDASETLLDGFAAAARSREVR
jgi:hypothetical protein